ncbi:MAG TPA: hypothetical protein VHT73_01315 [Thermodesulfobacteriota bacterium]|nr:hypothetical protein [Thermodesulfobacteriota bacterium]
MKKLIAPVGLIGASVLLGMGLMIGANIGAAVLKLAAPGLKKFQERRKQR